MLKLKCHIRDWAKLLITYTSTHSFNSFQPFHFSQYFKLYPSLHLNGRLASVSASVRTTSTSLRFNFNVSYKSNHFKCFNCTRFKYIFFHSFGCACPPRLLYSTPYVEIHLTVAVISLRLHGMWMVRGTTSFLPISMWLRSILCLATEPRAPS